MAIRSALVALAIVALAFFALPPAPAAACPWDDDCGDYGAPISMYGPQGPEAFQDLGTGLYTFNDGSTSPTYDPPSWSPPTLWDYVERAIDSLAGLFEAPTPSSDGSGIRN